MDQVGFPDTYIQESLEALQYTLFSFKNCFNTLPDDMIAIEK